MSADRVRSPLPGVLSLLLVAAGLDAAPESLHPDVSLRHVIDTGGSQSLRLDRDPISGDLYYLRRSGSIYRLTLDGKTASAERVFRGADTGVNSPLGFAFGPDGALYVAGNVDSGATTVGLVRRGVRLDPEPEARNWSTLASTAPYARSGTAFDHKFNGVAVSADGRHVFVNSGSRTDHGEAQDNGGNFPGAREQPLTATIFRLPADGDDLLLENDAAFLRDAGYLFASGLRNSFDLAFGPEGHLFATENSGDRDDHEELNWIREGHHYGFPWRIGTADTPMQFPGYDPEADRLVDRDYIAYREGFFHDDPEYPAPPPGVVFTEPLRNHGPHADSFRDPDSGAIVDAGDTGVGLGTFTAHRSPLGLVFDVDGGLGGDFGGDGFVFGWTTGDPAGDGRNGPFRDPGEDMLHLELTRAGESYELTATRIAAGFRHPIDAVLVGNRLYVLEYGGEGAVWEVTLPAAETVTLLRRGFVNEDGRLDLSDGVTILLRLFASRDISCADAADVNDDGEVNLTDPVGLFRFLFASAPPPPAPFASCGADDTADRDGGDLGCEDGPACD